MPPRRPPSSARVDPSTGLSCATAAAPFLALLAAVRPEVERRLAALWRAREATLSRHGAAVAAVVGAARELTLRGGKRFRPALLAAAYLGVAPRASMSPAHEAGVALELLQTYLLIQDDWIDGDAIRRGGPSVHAALSCALGSEKLGPASAILASDLTWSLAVETLTRLKVAPARALQVLQTFCRVHEDVVVGQQLDIVGRAEDVEAMHALKTGSYTVRGPLLVGATLAGAPRATLLALERYAAPLGVAFQLRDDLLGAFGSSASTGKPAGGDLRGGKRTAVLVEAEASLDRAGRAAVARAFGRPKATDAAVAAASRALAASGAGERVLARLEALCDRAEALSTRLPLTARARGLLASAASALRVDGASLPGLAPRGTRRRGAS